MDIIRCWYEKATDLYLITPTFWNEEANARYFPDRELVSCKAPPLTAEIRALVGRMIKAHRAIWMDAEVYLEQTEAKKKL